MKFKLAVLLVLLAATPVLAKTVDVEVKGKYKDHHFFHQHKRTVTSTGTIEIPDYPEEKRSEQGVGADILLHETDNVDLVAEYKYDWANADHSVYAVFKTKKSLFSIIKGAFNK